MILCSIVVLFCESRYNREKSNASQVVLGIIGVNNLCVINVWSESLVDAMAMN